MHLGQDITVADAAPTHAVCRGPKNPHMIKKIVDELMSCREQDSSIRVGGGIPQEWVNKFHFEKKVVFSVINDGLVNKICFSISFQGSPAGLTRLVFSFNKKNQESNEEARRRFFNVFLAFYG